VIGFLDCSTGVSGDKLLGAMLDAATRLGRYDAGRLQELARRLAPEAVVHVSPVSSHGIAALSVRIEAAETPAARHLSHIVDLIDAAGLDPDVAARAKAAFRALAEAEARIHGTGVEDVHFHEVGALDAIVDIVGTCDVADSLGLDSLVCTPVAVGAGVVEASHGTLPVPAPATLELLAGAPVFGGTVRQELTTPTGAALLGVLADGYGACPPMRPVTSGFGAGTRDIGTPNVCRLAVGEPDESAPTLTKGPVAVLETNIDHISPEAAAVAVRQLLDEGALDAWTSPIVMKKGRSAFSASFMVPAEAAEHFAQRVVVLTGALGVRVVMGERFMAQREVREAQTPYGPVRYKIGPAGPRAEADHVARIARDTGRSFASVADELLGYLT